MTPYSYDYPYPPPPERRPRWPWAVGAVLVLAIAAAATAAVLFHTATKRVEAVPPPPEPDYALIQQTAHDSTVALLSYRPDTARQTLTEATELLTGDFRASYTKLINDVVIPGAEDKRISATVTVAGVGITSVDSMGASVLAFVDQDIAGGPDPNHTANSVRLHLVNQDGRWLIDKFDPV